jgi:hypothetical protein
MLFQLGRLKEGNHLGRSRRRWEYNKGEPIFQNSRSQKVTQRIFHIEEPKKYVPP